MRERVKLLKWMLEDIRNVTLNGVKDLTSEELFKQPMEGEFPVGAYLMHLGEADAGWYHTIMENPMHEDLRKRMYYGAWFDVPKEEYNPPTSPISVEEYINAITEARKHILDYLDSINDEELKREITWKRNGKDITRSVEWILYHLIEHECHTRGQMFFLIRKGLRGKSALDS